MKNSEEAHKVTEQIYKNLNDNFIPNLKQLSLCARGYYKALTNVSNAARSYSDALLKLGETAVVKSMGPTQPIGAALHDISEIYKQLEFQTEEKMKSLMNDISFPLENTLESDLKNISSSYKRYNQEHKAIVIPFEKAQNTLTKMQKKKSRSKFNDKEAEYTQTISKAQMKLYEHRVTGLQKAMTDEWKSHCFLLQCVCNMLSLDHNHYAKLHSMIAPNIEHWTRLCSSSDTTLPNIQNMFLTGADLHNYTDSDNDDMTKLGLLYNNSSYPSQRPPETNEPIFTKHPGNIIYSRQLSKPAPSEDVNMYVQAMHRHEATSDTQLSFHEGDMIKLIGEKAEGWHYGYNLKTKKYGWLPLSFTISVAPPSDLGHQKLSPHDDQTLSNRVKSTGDLLNSHESHLNMAPRRSSINNNFNDGPNSMPPVSPSQQGLSHNADSQNIMPSTHPYQASNNAPTPPPQPHLYSYPGRPSNNMVQFSTSQDNEYQNLSSLQPNSFEAPLKRIINSSPPLPPPPNSVPEVDYTDALDYKYYLNDKGYGGP